ncbi:MAG: hypothetical protein HY313_11095 [Acidobacteria bacterium]|nr:hypothetical protein [Acidobacteriota bacterium]
MNFSVMTYPNPIITSIPVTFFEYCSGHLEIWNGKGEDFLGLSPAQWLEITHGGWKKLVPEEFHSEVRRLADLQASRSYATIEFPVSWGRATLWLQFLAAAAPEEGDKEKIVGLVQDITQQRQTPLAGDIVGGEPYREKSDEEKAEAWQDLRHQISAPLTSILLHCDLLLESESSPDTRQRLETILSEALRIDHYLRAMPV